MEEVFVARQLIAASMASSTSNFVVFRNIANHIRPTSKRVPSSGPLIHNVGKETIISTLGPMATDRDSLELFMKVVLGAKPWRLDPGLTAKVWTPYKFTKPLKIAIQWWDSVVQPHPPMTRALREVSEACKAAGMEVVEWNCEALDHRKGWDITSALYWPDGGKEVLSLLEEAGEPILPLSKFILQEQPTVKNMSMHELWQVRYYSATVKSVTNIPNCRRSKRGTNTVQRTPVHGQIPAKTTAERLT